MTNSQRIFKAQSLLAKAYGEHLMNEIRRRRREAETTVTVPGVMRGSVVTYTGAKNVRRGSV